MGWSCAVGSIGAGVRRRVSRHAARAPPSIIRWTSWFDSPFYSPVIAAALSDSLARLTPAGKDRRCIKPPGFSLLSMRVN
jgi:hypothetical protein